MSTLSTDPVADMLSRIRNGIAVHKSQVAMPHSKLKEAVAHLLKDSNFIDAVSVSDAPVGKTLTLTINSPQRNARITAITRMSTPGRRQYAGAGNIPTVKQGRGLVIVSTSKGIMSGAQAKSANVGGELICKVY